MNKKIRILGIFLYFTVAFSFVSCNDYLDVTLLDQLTQDETFSKRVSTEQYLAHVYSYLPREYEYLEEGSAVPRSDEAMFSWYQWSTTSLSIMDHGDLLLQTIIFGKQSIQA